MYSGEKFSALYHIVAAGEAEALARGEDICIEQTVEFPADLIQDEHIRRYIFGQVVRLERVAEGVYAVEIHFGAETSGGELPQLLNVLFGNISIKPGVRLITFELPASLLGKFRGPRYGRKGLRGLVGVKSGPLLCTAVKPMGKTPAELARLAYAFALGGMDMIKDDHGLSDQVFCPFRERVEHCAAAVAEANSRTGRNCLYMPNVTGPFPLIIERCHAARAAGAGGFVISPGLAGFDVMRHIADDDQLCLPVLAHPALQGSFTAHPASGIAHGALYGQINRLAGADAVIFPNFGGRFAFTRDECRDIVRGSNMEMGHIKPVFPVPAGGMKVEGVTEMTDFYGEDVILLIGGDLHRHGGDLAESCRGFAAKVSRRLV